MGKRITLSRPRMESLAAESLDRTELFAPVLRVVDPDDFFADDVRVTVDDVVTSVVVETVSVGVADCVAVEVAVAVSAADCAGRLQAAANATAAKAPASDSCPVIDRFPE
jgi:hypothetical protein